MAEKQIPVITQLGEVIGINKSDPTIDGGLQIIGNGTIGTNHLSASHLLIGIDTNGMGLDQNEIRTTGTNLHIGTLSSHYITFTTNKSNRMNISSAGNINIGDGTNAATEKLQVTGNFKIVGNNSAFSNFTSGYIGGAGWKINYDGSNSNLEVDNVLVRNTLQTHIFQKDVVKATNGQLYVSDSGVIAATNGSSTVSFTTASAQFSNNDLLHFKDIDPASGDINSVYFRINGSPSETGNDSMGNTSYTYNVDEITGSLSNLVVGGTAVRVSGGSVLLDASSPNSPFMDVIKDGTTFVRTGNLAGITTANSNLGSSGTLSGFGFYASGSAFLEGSIVATDGLVGGWTIEPGKIQSGQITLNSNDGSGQIIAGTLTSYSPNTTNYGFFADSLGNVLIKGNESQTNYIQFSQTALNIKTEAFRLDTPQLDIDSARYAIEVGSSIKISGSANSNAGQITVGSDVILNGDGSSSIAGWNIGSDIISSSGIKLDSDKTTIEAHSGQVYVNVGQTRQADGTFTGNYGISARSSTDVSFFRLDNAEKSIAGWDFDEKRISKALGTDGTPGKVIISATSSIGGGNFYDEDTNYTKGFSVRTRASNNTWNFNMGEVALMSGSGEMYTGSTGYVPDTYYGINVARQDNEGYNKELFVIAADGTDNGQENYVARIAGWAFDDKKFHKGDVTIDSDSEKITLGSSDNILLSGSGEGRLAGGNITFDKDGVTTIQGAVTIADDVTVNAEVAIGSLPALPNNEHLKGHWSFDSETAPYHDFSNNGQSGTHHGTDWVFQSNGGVVSNAIETKEGGGVQLLLDGDVNTEYSQSYCGWFKPSGIHADGDGGNGRLLSRDWSAYWAWMEGASYNSDGKATLEIGRSADHANFANGLTSGSWHFIAMTLDYNSTSGSAYLYKPDGTLVTGSFNCGTNPAVDPDGSAENVNSVNLACNSDDNSISNSSDSDNWSGSIDELRYYNKVLTPLEIDALYLNPAGQRQTIISGDSIQTGKIQSSNWPGAGSELDLNAGTIKLGGSTSPDFSVTSAGVVSASAGRIGGWDINNKYIGYFTGNDHMYLARDAHGFDSSNYTANKPVLSVYNTARNFKIDIGNTLYGASNNSGIMCWYDYQNLNGKLFEMSTDGTNFTASIASFDFTNTKLEHNNGNSQFMITNNPKVDISGTGHANGEGKSNIMILDGDSDFLLSMGASTWDNTSQGSNAGIVVYNDYVENSKIFEATSRRDSHEGNITASIAGWNFDTTRIYAGPQPSPIIDINSSDERITIGGESQIVLSGSGEGHLAGGKISFTKEGNFSINNVTSIHETFSDDITANGLFVTSSLLNSQTIVTQTDDSNGITKYETGGTGSVFLNNSSGWKGGFMSIAKFKRSLGATLEVDIIVNAASPATFIGFAPADSTMTDLETTNNYNHLVEGIYLQSRDIRVYSDHNNSGTPSEQGGDELGSNVWTGGTDKWMRLKIELKPDGGADYTTFRDGDYSSTFTTYSTTGNTEEDVIVWVNTHYSAAYMIFDDMRVYNANQNSLVIDGGNIVAGKIRSNNFTADMGSEFDLNAGTIKLGGITAPKFAVNTRGAVTSSAGTIAGWNITDININTTGSDGTTLEVNKDKGILARPSSHSIDTFAGEFSFEQEVNSVGPGGGNHLSNPGGQQYNSGGGGSGGGGTSG